MSSASSKPPQIIEARFGVSMEVLLLVLGLMFCGGAIGMSAGSGACLGVLFAIAGCACLYMCLFDFLRPHRLVLTPSHLRMRLAWGRKAISRSLIARFEQTQPAEDDPQINIMDRTGFLIGTIGQPWVGNEVTARQLREQLARYYPEIPWKPVDQDLPDQSESVGRPESQIVEAEDSPLPTRLCLQKNEIGRVSLVAKARPELGLPSLLSLMATGLTGAAILCGVQATRERCFLVLFMFAFGIAAAALWAGVAGSIGCMQVTFEPGQLRVTRRIGPFSRSRELAVREIKEVSYEQVARLEGRQWYSVDAAMADGRKVQLASMIPGQAATKWFVRQVTERIGNP